MAIDWNSLLTEFNERYNTTYDLKSMLSFLYDANKSMLRMEQILGVSKYSIREKMAFFNIPIQKKGGDYRSRAVVLTKFLSIPDATMAQMTVKEIAEEIGANLSYTYTLTDKFKRPCNALRRRLNEQCSNTGTG